MVKYCFYRQMAAFVFLLLFIIKCIWSHLFISPEKKNENNLQYFNPGSLILLQSSSQCINRFHCHCCYKRISPSLVVLCTGKYCNWRVWTGAVGTTNKTLLFHNFHLIIAISHTLEYSFFYSNTTKYFCSAASQCSQSAQLHRIANNFQHSNHNMGTRSITWNQSEPSVQSKMSVYSIWVFSLQSNTGTL